MFIALLSIYLAGNLIGVIAAFVAYGNYMDKKSMHRMFPDAPPKIPETFPTKGALIFIGYGITMWFIKFCASPLKKKE